MTVKHSAGLILAIVALTSCATVTAAQTSEQRAYAAVGEYRILLEAAFAYAERPAEDRNEKLVKEIAGIDREARFWMLAVVSAVEDRDTEGLASASTFLESLTDRLRSHLIDVGQLASS